MKEERGSCYTDERLSESITSGVLLHIDAFFQRLVLVAPGAATSHPIPHPVFTLLFS